MLKIETATLNLLQSTRQVRSAEVIGSSPVSFLLCGRPGHYPEPPRTRAYTTRFPLPQERRLWRTDIGDIAQPATTMVIRMAVGASREEMRLTCSLLSFWMLNTFLQHMSTLCSHALRFPENLCAEGLVEMAATGAPVSSSDGCHIESNNYLLDGARQEKGHQGWDEGLECFVAEASDADVR